MLACTLLAGRLCFSCLSPLRDTFVHSATKASTVRRLLLLSRFTLSDEALPSFFFHGYLELPESGRECYCLAHIAAGLR